VVHQYKLNGYNIVLDINSGSVHVVDDLAYDAISMFEETCPDKIEESLLTKYNDVSKRDILELLDDIERLKSSGKLFSQDIYGDIISHQSKNQSVVKALCLHVSHTCNLNCDYCFAAQGKYNGEHALMPFEVGRQALDFLIDNSNGRKNLEVDFFGGEPLMNWDVVKNLVLYARGQEKIHYKNFRFTLTTNGVLIDDDVIDFANKEMSNVVLSLDGRKKVHDRMRKTINGQGSYDVVVPKFKEFVDRRGSKDYYIRGTFTHENVDFVEDIKHMAGLGFKNLSMEPVVCSDDDPFALTDEDITKALSQYEILATEMLKRSKSDGEFTFYHYIIDLSHGPCIYKRIKGCGAGTEYLAVTPKGELFPCHQFVGDSKYLIGDIWTGIKNKNVCLELESAGIYSRDECRQCWARFYCSGGCFANAYHSSGSLQGIYKHGCELFKKRIECAIMLKIAQSV
jgi:uncharacterized protein